ncbi:MAG: PAS domain S-box protein, partial [Deltaproteobacteria bacterium]|nr:PAS domain S-box protein [Deltaproteobacteria bacterium]
VVVAVASPYIKVRVAIGHHVSNNWREAVTEAVSAPEIAGYFRGDHTGIWQKLTQEGKSAFAMLFSPGNTKAGNSHSYGILNKLKEMSLGRLPVFGGSAADDWRMESNYILYGTHAYPDALLVAVFETSLRFGIGLAHGFTPGTRRATVTRARNHVVLELDGLPAAEVYAKMVQCSRAELESKHLTLTCGGPLGSPGPYGQYSVNVASYFTADGGLRLCQPVPEGAILTLMEADPNTLVTAGREAARKALLRGDIQSPAMVLVFSCALRHRLLKQRTQEEISHIKEMFPDVPVAGFYSFGEQGLADDNVNRHNNMVTTVLTLGKELSFAAKVSEENKKLVKRLNQEIFERRRTEIILKASQKTYWDLYENAPTAYFSVSAVDGSILRCNAAAARLSGYDRKTLITMKIQDLYDPSDEGWGKAQEIFKAMQAGKSVMDVELKMKHKNGVSFWISLSVEPIRDVQGNVVESRSAVIDIDKRKRAEQRLQHEHSFRTAIIEKAAEGLCVCHEIETYPYVRFTVWNDRMTEITGYTMEQINKLGWYQTVYPDPKDQQAAKTCMARMRTGDDLRAERWEITRADGKKRIMNISTSVLETHDGSIHVLALMNDVTEQEEAQAALRQGRAVLQALLDATSDVTVLQDRSGTILGYNGALLESLGLDDEQLNGQCIYDFLPTSVAQARKTYVEQVFSSGKPVHFEEEREARTLQTAIYPILDARGDVTQAAVFVRDVTEQRATERRIRQMCKLEALGTLAGGIAHDFNNLLMTIQGNVSLMITDLEPSDPHHALLSNVEESVRSGARLTRQLLGYARKGQYHVEPVDLNALINQTCETFGRARKEIRIHKELAKDVWAVKADQGQIEQVLLNLYVNAADAMPDGGDLYIWTENISHLDMQDKEYTPKPGKYVCLYVADTGGGMDRGTLERIFDPFFTTKKLGRGTGLGLASTYGIIKGHGGYIDVDSQKDTGTTFNIYLPATAQKPEQPRKGPQAVLEGRGVILLVDDEPTVLDVGAKLLNKLGYTVLTASSGRDALNLYQEKDDEVDLILLDMVMPDMGGAETFDGIKKINPSAKVLLASGYAQDGRAGEILKRGCNGFIQKPFSIQELSETIKDILGPGSASP